MSYEKLVKDFNNITINLRENLNADIDYLKAVILSVINKFDKNYVTKNFNVDYYQISSNVEDFSIKSFYENLFTKLNIDKENITIFLSEGAFIRSGEDIFKGRNFYQDAFKFNKEKINVLFYADVSLKKDLEDNYLFIFTLQNGEFNLNDIKLVKITSDYEYDFSYNFLSKVGLNKDFLIFSLNENTEKKLNSIRNSEFINNIIRKCYKININYYEDNVKLWDLSLLTPVLLGIYEKYEGNTEKFLKDLENLKQELKIYGGIYDFYNIRYKYQEIIPALILLNNNYNYSFTYLLNKNRIDFTYTFDENLLYNKYKSELVKNNNKEDILILNNLFYKIALGSISSLDIYKEDDFSFRNYFKAIYILQDKFFDLYKKFYKDLNLNNQENFLNILSSVTSKLDIDSRDFDFGLYNLLKNMNWNERIDFITKKLEGALQLEKLDRLREDKNFGITL